jgi:hypothetical protein
MLGPSKKCYAQYKFGKKEYFSPLQDYQFPLTVEFVLIFFPETIMLIISYLPGINNKTKVTVLKVYIVLI